MKPLKRACRGGQSGAVGAFCSIVLAVPMWFAIPGQFLTQDSWSGGPAVQHATQDSVYQQYLGTYLPTHRDGEFTVLTQNGRLAVRLPPNPQTFELKQPAEDGKWYFLVSDQMAVSFEKDRSGQVIVMKVHQGGRQYECIRSGVELPAEMDLDELARYVGSYTTPSSQTTFTVLVQNNRLAVDVGAAVLELHPPDENGRWIARIDPGVSVRFDQGEDGWIASLVFYGGEAPEVELTRVVGG